MDQNQQRRGKLRVPPGNGTRLVTPGAEVARCRAHLGLSRENFAALFGISWSTVERWEKGRGTPSPWYLGVCRVLASGEAPDSVSLAGDLARIGPVAVFCELVRRTKGDL